MPIGISATPSPNVLLIERATFLFNALLSALFLIFEGAQQHRAPDDVPDPDPVEVEPRPDDDDEPPKMSSIRPLIIEPREAPPAALEPELGDDDEPELPKSESRNEPPEEDEPDEPDEPDDPEELDEPDEPPNNELNKLDKRLPPEDDDEDDRPRPDREEGPKSVLKSSENKPLPLPLDNDLNKSSPTDTAAVKSVPINDFVVELPRPKRSLIRFFKVSPRNKPDNKLKIHLNTLWMIPEFLSVFHKLAQLMDLKILVTRLIA